MTTNVAKTDSAFQKLLGAVNDQVSAMRSDSTAAAQLQDDATVAYIANSYDVFKKAMSAWCGDYTAISGLAETIAGQLGAGGQYIDQGDESAAAVAQQMVPASLQAGQQVYETPGQSSSTSAGVYSALTSVSDPLNKQSGVVLDNLTPQTPTTSAAIPLNQEESANVSNVTPQTPTLPPSP